MKATVINPSRVKKGSAAAKRKMAKVRASRKKKKNPKTYIVRSKKMPHLKKASGMDKAHSNISGIIFAINRDNNISVDFSKSDLNWLTYILKKI